MIITTIMYSVKIIFPIFVSKYIIGQKTMDYYLKITPIRYIYIKLYYDIYETISKLINNTIFFILRSFSYRHNNSTYEL